MPEPKARKLAIAVLAILVVIIVIPAVALFVRGGGQSTTGPIDLNTASAELLEALPGIGPVRAGDIVADRGVNGPFLTVEQIMRLQGIGATTKTNIRDLVSVDTSP